MKPHVRLSLAAIAAVAAAPIAAMAQSADVLAPEVVEAFAQAAPDELIPVIIRHQDRIALAPPEPGDDRARHRRLVVRSLRSLADRSLPAIEEELQRSRAREVERLWAINAVAAEVPAEALQDLAAVPGVESIRLDETFNEPGLEPATAAAPEWNIEAIGADDLWALGVTGEGRVVASLDSGVDPEHPELGPRWRGDAGAWYDPYGQHATPYDASGHGTQVMGLMVGGDSGGSSIGVAPGAQWIAARVFDDSGTGVLSRVHLAFQWALDPDGDPDTDDAPDVVNASWGLEGSDGGCEEEFREDVQALVASDIAAVFAAGNAGPDGDTSSSPANYPESFAVGATAEDGLVTDFSSRGPSACDGGLYPHVVAPGANVRTTDLTFHGQLPQSYTYADGTSFAAPQVSGGVALLRQAYPELLAGEALEALAQSARDLAPIGTDYDSGAGLIDLVAAHAFVGGDTGGGGDPAPGDADGDGYTVADGDCNDADAAIHPGADEVKLDGIDQDCNGYDLTIVITRADYDARRAILNVAATSELGADAALVVDGYGAMSWSARRGWSLSVRNVQSPPGSVTVSGIEGSETAPVESGGSVGRRSLRTSSRVTGAE